MKELKLKYKRQVDRVNKKNVQGGMTVTKTQKTVGGIERTTERHDSAGSHERQGAGRIEFKVFFKCETIYTKKGHDHRHWIRYLPRGSPV